MSNHPKESQKQLSQEGTGPSPGALSPSGKVQGFAGDEIKFHSPSESLCSRWRFSFSLHSALARQTQIPPTLSDTDTECWLRRSAVCVSMCVCVCICSCMLLAPAVSVPASVPVSAVSSPHTCWGLEIRLNVLLYSEFETGWDMLCCAMSCDEQNVKCTEKKVHKTVFMVQFPNYFACTLTFSAAITQAKLWSVYLEAVRWSFVHPRSTPHKHFFSFF